MARKPDCAHRMTDKELDELERRISAIYQEARNSLDETVRAYFESFRKRDEKMKKLIGTIRNGREWTEQDYINWRLAQIGRGERFQALRDKVAERMTKANETATAYVNDATPGIYSLNRNYAAYTIEQVAGDVGFDLWDEQTVKRLIVEQPGLMPYYPPKRALRRGIDLAWGKKQITASVTSSILQGRSIKGMADDLQTRIPEMNRASAIRTARTAVTGAQNAGRMDSYHAAEKMGIRMKKEWLATLDNRTRHAHAVLDGQQADVDKPFKVNGEKIRYPGDPMAAGYLVYNCRCTLVAAVDGVDTSDAQRWVKDLGMGKTKLIRDMSYQEWAGWKKGKSSGDSQHDAPGKPVLVGMVDFTDKKEVMRVLNNAEKELQNFNFEVNYSVTKDGKVWRVSGDNASINPTAIPSDLAGSYSYHNHPSMKTNYSFSAEDVAFFISSGESVSIASDDLYVYVMKRTADTIEKTADEVYHRFKEIEKTDVLEMKWKQVIDPDMDGYHETMKILSRELNFKYGRKEKT